MDDFLGHWEPVHGKMWVDGKFRRLSKPQPNATSLFLYLLTAYECSSVPGLILVYPEVIARRFDWKPADVRCVAQGLISEKMIEVDWELGLWFIRNRLRYKWPDSSKNVQGWVKTLAQLPDCALKWRAIHKLINDLDAREPKLAEPLRPLLQYAPSDAPCHAPSDAPCHAPSDAPPDADRDRDRDRDTHRARACARDPLIDQDLIALAGGVDNLTRLVAEHREFLRLMPRKNRGDESLILWVRKKPPLDKIKKALTWQKRLPSWREDGWQRAPNPYAYLEDNRWEDDPPAPDETTLPTMGTPKGFKPEIPQPETPEQRERARKLIRDTIAKTRKMD